MRILKSFSVARRRRRARESNAWMPVIAVLILATVLGLLAQGACLPHTHTGVGLGLYNAEHDLTLLAISGAVAPAPGSITLSVTLVIAALSVSALPAPTAFVSRDAESRAPPA